MLRIPTQPKISTPIKTSKTYQKISSTQTPYPIHTFKNDHILQSKL